MDDLKKALKEMLLDSIFEQVGPVPRVIICGEKVIVSKHALERFLERWPDRWPKNPVQTIQKILVMAKEESLDPTARVRRLINNKCKPVSYFIAEGWRFVVSEDEPKTLITIERNKYWRNRYGF